MADQYRYRYLNEDGTPLQACPFCKHCLTKAGGITVETVLGGISGEFYSRLIPETGDLVDSDDGAVLKGFHSQTCCGNPGCGEPLYDYETSWEPDGDGNDEEAGFEDGEEEEDEDEGEDEEPDERPARAKLVINDAVALRHDLIDKYGPQGEEIYDLILERGEPIFGVVTADAE